MLPTRIIPGLPAGTVGNFQNMNLVSVVDLSIVVIICILYIKTLEMEAWPALGLGKKAGAL